MRKGNYFTGTSGLVLPFKNKAFFPEEYKGMSRLEVYGKLFNSIEINSSFYNLPMPKTMERWAATVPEAFRFSFKLWQGISHARDLNFSAEDVIRFLQVINGVGDHKGCLLIQFPPSLRAGAITKVKELLEVFRAAEESQGWQLAMEFRHQSWYRDETRTMLGDYQAIMVYHDKSQGAITMDDQESDVIYVRFHGPEGNYRHSYDDSYLYEYAQYVREWLDAGKDVYAYFNNTIGEAVSNLETLKSYVLAR
ncbi:DUF72 domain-containing protein [Chitinophaga sp. Cy-1792]|uniref:DUF72 domain-containing protein n=1 Tax=Chitinophaga sp. Cy-1792 TaxID=2608339 RepID=UPI001423C895|nr:DUF72 domain-containing protein [Chitinophaga sp. Cy-1792]NIG55583.1 DUF72 domain-containing protein [Chitinophaga sp. Cy-1792]